MEQLLIRISMPLSAGGLGLRPIHRIRHAAELLRLYPHLASAVEAQSCGVFSELQLCRQVLLEQGSGTRREKHRLQQQQQLTLEQMLAGFRHTRPPDPSDGEPAADASGPPAHHTTTTPPRRAVAPAALKWDKLHEDRGSNRQQWVREHPMDRAVGHGP
jgi:hypothetical protein